MAKPLPPYDPVKSVEGMFNGSLIRIGQIFKDPANYGPDSRAVLSEVAKRYQDALDDCEIQILEAKWYLEHQLALSKARRIAQALAQESGINNAKRTLEESKILAEATPAGAIENERPAKRQKTEGAESTVPAVATDETSEATPQVNGDLKETSNPTTEPETSSKPKAPLEIVTQIAPEVPESKSTPKAQLDPFAFDSTRPSTAAGNSGANSVVNFESMFGPPTDEAMPNAESATNNLDFELEDLNANPLADDANGNINNLNMGLDMQDPASLSSLLPGLESYANQSNDDAAAAASSLNFGSGGIGADGLLPDANFSADAFELPALESNTFDDMLNGDFGGDFGTGTGVGGDVDDFMNDDNLMDLQELDDSFFD